MTEQEKIRQDAPLYEALCDYAAQGRASFHTPGHKGQAADLLSLPLWMDLTELPETDSLFECSGAIREAERRAAELFGAADTAISAGGCTLAIQGMLAAFTKPGDTVLFSRNLHRSAVNTAMLLDLRPVWLAHSRDAGEGLPGRIAPSEAAAALTAHPGAAAVYLTSPDYYGCLSDLNGIAAVCRQYGVPMLVDNAHGTHLIAFGLHPLQCGASASACSAHKTLPVLTGGAWLHCADPDAAGRLKSAMALFGSTSPCYLTMASLDVARAWLARDGMAAFRRLAETVDGLRTLAREVGFGLPQGECDPVRLTLLPSAVGYGGEEAADYFRRQGAECEHCDRAAVVFILTPFNSERDIAVLRRAIERFPVRAPISLPAGETVLPSMAMPPRAALTRGSVRVPTEQAAGRIAAEAACPCPPGVPIVMPGERVDDKCVKILLNTGIHEISVLQ